jgi:NAD dependent epimerase/dehydratase family enzyme
MPGKFGFLVKTGNGKQSMPWIHIADLCGIYLMAITDTGMSGSNNAVAPQQVTHAEFMKTLGEVMKRPVLKVPVPSLLLKAIMGQMSDVILNGSRVSSEKIIRAGYKFKFANQR